MSALHRAGRAGRRRLRVPPRRPAKQEAQHHQHFVAARHADSAAPVHDKVGGSSKGGKASDGANGSDSPGDCPERLGAMLGFKRRVNQLR